VRDECLAFAQVSGIKHGVFGGLSAAERRTARRTRQRATTARRVLAITLVACVDCGTLCKAYGMGMCQPCYQRDYRRRRREDLAANTATAAAARRLAAG
jgi:hypothetical protein